jgi:RNA polymerase sigma-70 factor (ECF subfamily)
MSVSLEPSDDDLAGQAARGDKAAFTGIAARYRRRITSMAARIAGRAAAEDIVQETLTRAWIHAPSWKNRRGDPHAYAGWLFRVAMNLATDQLRRGRSAVNLDCAGEMPDPAADAETLLIRRERMARLESALVQLPGRQRMAISLTYDADLSNKDAASAMGISAGAFELLLVRARRTLRLAVSEEEKP